MKKLVLHTHIEEVYSQNSLELMLKSVEHEMYIVHCHNVVYPW